MSRQYEDNRPSAQLRMDAQDHGPVFRHGFGPEECDALGAREASVVYSDGLFHLFYDGAKPHYGWQACLATSTDLINWQHAGVVLPLGAPGCPDSHTATSPWFLRHGSLWHMFYVACQQTSPPPDCIPAVPYLTCKAEAEDLRGPWRKRYDVVAVRPQPGTYYGETACPGFLFEFEGQIHMFFSTASGHLENGVYHDIKRGLGLLHASHPDGPWQVDPAPAIPNEEQVENSSLYYEPTNQTWFLFTNHIGIGSGMEYTDAIYVYWSDNPLRWKASRKAVVLDGQNCSWSKQCVGMPSVIVCGDRLAILYDAPGGDSVSHMGRDIGLAWLPLPLQIPD